MGMISLKNLLSQRPILIFLKRRVNKERSGEAEREIFHLLVHSAKNLNTQARLKVGDWNSTWSCQVLEPPSVALTGKLSAYVF